MKLITLFRGLLLLIFLPACSGIFSAPVPITTPVPATDTATATIIWFPATNTPTTFSTQTILPTPDQRPGLGGLIFTDTFDQPELWNTSSSNWASASVLRNRLVLSISGAGPVSIASLRSQPVLDNFYAEAAASINLCSNKDQFGMIFRAASGSDYYRYSINCNGQVRLERGRGGSHSPLVDWLPSGDAPLGAPAEVKLGIWAMGTELRFFLNDRYQFTARDSQLRAGTLGFFVYANGKTPITASFAELSVYPVSYIAPTSSPTASQTPRP